MSSVIRKEFTFDSFVVGEFNRFAYNASQAVAESPGEAFIPLFIYGKPGTGKTHLVHAVGKYIKENNNGIKVLYVTADMLIKDLIKAIRDDVFETFRDKYYSSDVLLIDDIQCIAGKEATQDEICRLIDHMFFARKQIVISSDTFLWEEGFISERLYARFMRGIVVEAGLPDFETKYTILKNYADLQGVTINNEVLNCIAKWGHPNGFELEGYINKLITHSKYDKYSIADVSVEYTKCVLGFLF